MVENWSVHGPLRPEAVPRRPASKRENPTGSWAKKSYEAIVLFISLLILRLLFPQFLRFCKLFVIGESWNFARRRERGTRERSHQNEKKKKERESTWDLWACTFSLPLKCFTAVPFLSPFSLKIFEIFLASEEDKDECGCSWTLQDAGGESPEEKKGGRE